MGELRRWAVFDREGWADGQRVDRATQRGYSHEVGMARASDLEKRHRDGKRYLCPRSKVFCPGLHRDVRCVRRIPPELMGESSPGHRPRSRIVPSVLFVLFVLGNDYLLRS